MLGQSVHSRSRYRFINFRSSANDKPSLVKNHFGRIGDGIAGTPHDLVIWPKSRVPGRLPRGIILRIDRWHTILLSGAKYVWHDTRADAP